MIGKILQFRMVFSPIMAIFVISFRMVLFYVRHLCCLNKVRIDHSLVFVSNNNSTFNVLSRLAKSLALRAREQGNNTCVVDATELHRYIFSDCKIVYMHWALSCYALFFRYGNLNILWYSHTRLNVFPYLPFFRYIDKILFQNSLDACMVRSHVNLANYHIFPGIVYDYPRSRAAQSLTDEWDNRPYDICFYLAMNSASPLQYYNIRKNISYSIDLAAELSSCFSVNLLLNQNAYNYITETMCDRWLLSNKHFDFEMRHDFPDNLSQLSSARYFVNSSLLEGGPLSILESIYAGCLPISSLYSMASSIPEISSMGLFFDINRSPKHSAACIKAVIYRKLSYDESINRLFSAASGLTEISFVNLLTSI